MVSELHGPAPARFGQLRRDPASSGALQEVRIRRRRDRIVQDQIEFEGRLLNVHSMIARSELRSDSHRAVARGSAIGGNLSLATAKALSLRDCRLMFSRSELRSDPTTARDAKIRHRRRPNTGNAVDGVELVHSAVTRRRWDVWWLMADLRNRWFRQDLNSFSPELKLFDEMPKRAAD